MADDLRIDGDLLKEIILDACPHWMSDEFTREFAEQILTDCARSGYMTVVRGPDSAVWHPDMVNQVMQRIDEVLAESEVQR